MLKYVDYALWTLSAVVVGVGIWVAAPNYHAPTRAEVVQHVRQASVRITINGSGLASGVVLAEDGRIITAAHVCVPGADLDVVAWNGTVVRDVEVLWVGQSADLCLIDVPGYDWTPAVVQADEPEIGEPVIHVGNYIPDLIAFGTIGVPGTGVDSQYSLTYVGTAGPGSSGGGVFNMRGELLGLIYSGDQYAVGPFLRIPKGAGDLVPAAAILRLLVQA